MFELDLRLQQDTIDLGSLPLCRLLLMNESTYLWFVLVPQLSGIREIHHLNEVDLEQLWRESTQVSRWMESSFQFDKLNVAALGNVVSQLHLHHVARRKDDPAWPGPVWGHRPPIPYSDKEIAVICQQAENGLDDLLVGEGDVG